MLLTKKHLGFPGFFRGNHVVFVACSAEGLSVSFPWVYRVSCNLPSSSQLLLTSICAVISSLSLFVHVGLSHILFLACILVRFQQGEKNGCVSTSILAADYLVQLFCQRHGIAYFSYRCFFDVLKWSYCTSCHYIIYFSKL